MLESLMSVLVLGSAFLLAGALAVSTLLLVWYGALVVHYVLVKPLEWCHILHTQSQANS